MLIKEDNINYQKQSLFIGFPSCNWKCELEANCHGMCQNSTLALAPDINVTFEELISVYKESPLNEAIVCGGLEPLDSWDDLFGLIQAFREQSEDDVVIYTGYNESECKDKINQLKQFKNIIVKFGRFVPNQEKHLDPILGVHLASPNQYAKKIS